MLRLGPQAIGTNRDYGLLLEAPDKSSLAGRFTGAETFRAILWTGDDQAAAATLSASWDSGLANNPTGQAKPRVKLTVSKTAIASLAAQSYYLSVVINPGTDDVDVVPPGTTLTITPSAGSAAALPVYCSYQDCLDYCPWLPLVVASNPSIPQDIAPQRARARTKLEDVLVSRYRPWSRRGTRGGYQLGQPGTGSWGPLVPTNSLWLRDQLAANKLMTTGPRGDRVREITAKWAISIVLENQLGMETSSDLPYMELGRRYEAQAKSLLLSWTAELDISGDGTPDLWIPCGVASSR